MVEKKERIDDERTTGEAFRPSFDKQREDVTLLVLRGPDAGKRIKVPPQGGVIGRQPEVEVHIRDANVSRQHARIEVGRDGRVTLVDLGSRSGVFVNGVQVSKAELFDGNHVQLSADTVLRVRFQDPTETELLDQLQGAVVRDPLTGLPNRRYLKDRLAQEVSYGRRHKIPVAVLMGDIDDLKKVNDADGQKGGDQLICLVARTIREHTRLEDVVGRYGGDELIVLMRGTREGEAMPCAERLLRLVRAKKFDVGDVAIRATISMGVAAYEPDVAEIDEVQRLLDRADSSLYRAKTHGKDKAVRWSEGRAGIAVQPPSSKKC